MDNINTTVKAQHFSQEKKKKIPDFSVAIQQHFSKPEMLPSNPS